MNKSIDEKLLKKIRRIKLLILDVDGVLTDGRIIIDDLGNETKKFDVRDGHGLRLLMRYGIDIVLLTGRKSKAVEYRAKDLGIEEVHQNAKNKVEVLEGILQKRNIDGDSVAYIGDDIIDVPVFLKVGFSVAVADAVIYAREAADYITEKRGGRGAVREICEMILKVQEKWGEIASRYDLNY
ncbi:MAG: HAD-IIIA family hydrolase [Thermodesulfobacteriota bacterium]|nr:HAD-IIIA family hydrolase [Thermodesulfobacteriota bacterium]